MYESKHHRPVPTRHFLWRLARHAFAAGTLVGVSLGGGMAGYMYFEHLPWRDAFLNAAMLLGGMGPVNPPVSPAGKLFAGTFALYAGLVFLVVLAMILTPVVHRVLHTFHWEGQWLRTVDMTTHITVRIGLDSLLVNLDTGAAEWMTVPPSWQSRLRWAAAPAPGRTTFNNQTGRTQASGSCALTGTCFCPVRSPLPPELA